MFCKGPDKQPGVDVECLWPAMMVTYVCRPGWAQGLPELVKRYVCECLQGCFCLCVALESLDSVNQMTDPQCGWHHGLPQNQKAEERQMHSLRLK